MKARARERSDTVRLPPTVELQSGERRSVSARWSVGPARKAHGDDPRRITGIINRVLVGSAVLLALLLLGVQLTRAAERQPRSASTSRPTLLPYEMADGLRWTPLVGTSLSMPHRAVGQDEGKLR